MKRAWVSGHKPTWERCWRKEPTEAVIFAKSGAAVCPRPCSTADFPGGASLLCQFSYSTLRFQHNASNTTSRR
jgi:hypothetical protein